MWHYYFKFFRRLKWTDSWYLVKLMGVLVLLVFFFIIIFYYYEDNVTVQDSAWTAYITLTTVGYGDFAAKSWQGRLATVVITFFGIGYLTLFAGNIIERTLERRRGKMRGEGEYKGEGHIVVVNIPSYDEIGEFLNEIDSCKEFTGSPRVIIAPVLPNNDSEMPQSIMKRIDSFIRGVPSSMDTLKRVNMEKASACILLSSVTDTMLDNVNTMTAGIIEKSWPSIVTILDCAKSDTIHNLTYFGIDGGVNSTGLQMGLLVQELKDPGTFEVYNQLSSNSRGQLIYISKKSFSDWNIKEVTLTIGRLKRAVIDLDLPVTIMGIRKENNEVVLNLPSDYNVKKEDRLIYMAAERFDWRSNADKIVSARND